MRIKRPSRRLGQATVRYLRHIRGGFDGPTALLATAYEMGLQANLVDGSPPTVIASKWTLDEMDDLTVVREFVRLGLGGISDGAARYPQYVDGFVEPP